MFTRILLIASVSLFASSGFSAEDRNVTQYNLEGKLALKGYDPVSFFPEGGERPAAGTARFQEDYKGVTYLFSSQQNRDLFFQNPDKYEPTYGGWCAWAMANGSKVDIRVEHYVIYRNRIHFFVGNRPLRRFVGRRLLSELERAGTRVITDEILSRADHDDIDMYEARADENWKSISGESARGLD